MESPNLTLLNQFLLKGPISRYGLCRVNYPPNSSPMFEMLIDVDSSLSVTNIRKDSLEEDFTVENECILYATNKSVHSIDIREPSYVQQQTCLNLEKDARVVSAIQCMTGFPLPLHYKTNQRQLAVATGLMIIYDKQADGKLTQTIKIFEDRGKEIQYEVSLGALQLLYQSRIIWVNSHYIPFEKGCLTLIIIGYSDNRVSIYSLTFDSPHLNLSQSHSQHTITTISLIVNYQFNETILYHDVLLLNTNKGDHDKTIIDFALCFTSFDGLISLCFLNLLAEIKDYQYKLSLVFDNLQKMVTSRIVSQPKFFKHKPQDTFEPNDLFLEGYEGSPSQDQELVYLAIPIQNGELIIYRDIDTEKTSIKQYERTSLREGKQIQELVIAFDVQEKRRQFQILSSGNIFEICLIYLDGTLQIYEMILEKDLLQARLQLMKQINNPCFFLGLMQFSNKQFVAVASDEELDVYELSYYQIN